MKLISTIIVSCLAATSAIATPVLVSHQWAFEPGKEAQVVQAFNAYDTPSMFKGGEQGAVYINQFQMDASPATHDFAVFYKDATAAEATMDARANDRSFAQFVGKLNGVGQYLGSTYYAIVGTYGEASSGLNKWTAYNFNITNPALAARAMQEWRASETGKSAPGSAFLAAARAGAPAGVTHILVALYPSRAEYENWIEKASGTDDWKKFQNKMNRAGTQLGAIMGQSAVAAGSTENVAEFISE